MLVSSCLRFPVSFASCVNVPQMALKFLVTVGLVLEFAPQA